MPTKGRLIRDAIAKMEEAIVKLEAAKTQLRYARNRHNADLEAKIADLREIYDILTDPECTPEIEEVE